MSQLTMQSMTREEFERIMRSIMRDELERIFKTVMMYTFDADLQAQKSKPLLNQPIQVPSSVSQVVTQPAVANQFSGEGVKQPDFNLELCNWELKQGSKGAFEMARTGSNFVLLKNYLLAHEKHRATVNGVFYWLFTDGDAVGRKEAKGGF